MLSAGVELKTHFSFISLCYLLSNRRYDDARLPARVIGRVCVCAWVVGLEITAVKTVYKDLIGTRRGGDIFLVVNP